MKLIKEVQEILDNYNLDVDIPEKYKTVYEYQRDDIKCDEEFHHPVLTDSFLYEKYKEYIPKGWYGFDIGSPTPKNWKIVLDEIVQLCIKNDSDFEIHQIKMKFGSICFYCESDVIEDIWDVSLLIGNKLSNIKLRY